MSTRAVPDVVIPVIWPRKDGRGFYLLFTRHFGPDVEVIIHPVFTESLPDSERRAVCLDFGAPEFMTVEDQNRPGMMMFGPAHTPLGKFEAAIQAITVWISDRGGEGDEHRH